MTRRFRDLNDDRTPAGTAAPIRHRIAAGHPLVSILFDASGAAPQTGGGRESFIGEPEFFAATVPGGCGEPPVPEGFHLQLVSIQ
jgi:hypothetical protein